MMRQKLKNPPTGYATDFIDFIRRALPAAGREAASGWSPTPAASIRRPAAQKIFEVARELGIPGCKVGVVEGDDLLGRLPDLVAARPRARATWTPASRSRRGLAAVTSANAYLGARPVAEALAGRARRSSSAAASPTPRWRSAPLVHEFGWAADDWDRLAAGTIAGHILECGAQCDRRQLQPLVGGARALERRLSDRRGRTADGSFVGHQAPGHRRHGDGRHRLRAAGLRDGRPERATSRPTSPPTSPRSASRRRAPTASASRGSRGRPKTPFLKISASYLDGYKAAGQVTVSGPRAIEKARLAAEIVWKRLARAGVTFAEDDRREPSCSASPACCRASCRRRPIRRRWCCASRCATPTAPRSSASARRSRRSSPPARPGVTGFAGGRPKPQEVVAYWPALLAARGGREPDRE